VDLFFSIFNIKTNDKEQSDRLAVNFRIALCSPISHTHVNDIECNRETRGRLINSTLKHEDIDSKGNVNGFDSIF